MRTNALTKLRELPAYCVITQAIHERGETQEAALGELRRRGLWLSDDQKRQAGLHAPPALPLAPSAFNFVAFLAQRWQTHHWCCAPRLTPSLRQRGYDRAVRQTEIDDAKREYAEWMRPQA